MAIGVRKAFQEIADPDVRQKFMAVPYIGIDGVRTTGQEWLQKGLLTATVLVPPNTDIAIQMLTDAVQTGTIPPEKTLTVPKSLPAVEELVKKASPRGQLAKAYGH
jgi:hypothetical protein